VSACTLVCVCDVVLVYVWTAGSRCLCLCLLIKSNLQFSFICRETEKHSTNRAENPPGLINQLPAGIGGGLMKGVAKGGSLSFCVLNVCLLAPDECVAISGLRLHIWHAKLLIGWP